jgi:DNA topoisomerase VI subunit B
MSAGSASPTLFGRALAGASAASSSASKAASSASVASAGCGAGTGAATAAAAAAASAAALAPARVSFCRLDIDIDRNTPQVLVHTQTPNAEGWVGTQISVVISGAWSTYRARILQYFQQLAVITPYAHLSLSFAQRSDISLLTYTASGAFAGPGAGSGAAAGGSKHDFTLEWRRRSTQVPRPPREVKHHPSAVNDLLLQQLVTAGRAARSGAGAAGTLAGFLTSQFQCIDREAAVAVAADAGLAPDAPTSAFSAKEIHAVRVALERTSFPPPSGLCLSPAGEYNLRLGIMKELRPDLVATAASPVGVFQGHPFMVEAGVALGGRGAEGLTVHRFANRIPLLFEGGGDVATQTATKRLNWGAYKIDVARDKVAVFVSLVSTKVPFKGTGKEYIGDDIHEIRDAVKAALQACCSQLRTKLARAAELRDRAGRRKTLTRYIPDVTRALLANLKSVQARAAERSGAAAAGAGAGAGAVDGGDGAADGEGAGAGTASSDAAAAAALAATGGATTTTAAAAALRARRARASLLREYVAGRITEAALARRLEEAVERADMDAALEQAAAAAAGVLAACGGGAAKGGGGGQPVFVGPVSQVTVRGLRELHHPVCVLKLLPGVLQHHEPGTFAVPASAYSRAGGSSHPRAGGSAAGSAVPSAARSVRSAAADERALAGAAAGAAAAAADRSASRAGARRLPVVSDDDEEGGADDADSDGTADEEDPDAED